MSKNENITSYGVSSKYKEYYMAIIRNSKEVTDSCTNDEKFKIVRMHLKRRKSLSKSVNFFGNIESENESRYISGRIYIMKNKAYIADGTVVRIGVPIEEDSIFSFSEEFIDYDSEILRTTNYGDVECIETISREDFFDKKEKGFKLVRGK